MNIEPKSLWYINKTIYIDLKKNIFSYICFKKKKLMNSKRLFINAKKIIYYNNIF